MQSLSIQSMELNRLSLITVLVIGVALVPCQVLAEAVPVEIGEQFFLETRFAQFFKDFVNGGGHVNVKQEDFTGDPTVDNAVNWKREVIKDFLPNDFTSMNGRSCHFVDEFELDASGNPILDYGMRTYTDFARRSPVPEREDGKTVTVRNSPQLVNASLPRKGGLLLHFDAEFKTMVDLVKATLTGRNYGYLPREKWDAINISPAF